MTRLFRNVPVLDSGARGSTTTFVQRGQGDVLLAWENEAFLAVNQLGKGKFDIVVPSVSILAEPPVAVVDKVVDKKGTRKVAEAYLRYLYTPQAQDIIAKHYYRPRNPQVAARYKARFPNVKLFTIDRNFGGWAKGAGHPFQRRRRCSTRFSKAPSASRTSTAFQHPGDRSCGILLLAGARLARSPARPSPRTPRPSEPSERGAARSTRWSRRTRRARPPPPAPTGDPVLDRLNALEARIRQLEARNAAAGAAGRAQPGPAGSGRDPRRQGRPVQLGPDDCRPDRQLHLQAARRDRGRCCRLLRARGRL